MIGVEDIGLIIGPQDLMKGKDTEMPLFDFQEKRRIGMKRLKISSSGIVSLILPTLGFGCYFFC